MNIDNTKAQMKKGILEMCILQVLSKKEAYPSDVINELRDAGLDIVEGTLYPLLTRLKNAGILAYRWEESTSGPPRKYYSLTPQGDTILTNLKESWEALEASVITILK